MQFGDINKPPYDEDNPSPMDEEIEADEEFEAQMRRLFEWDSKEFDDSYQKVIDSEFNRRIKLMDFEIKYTSKTSVVTKTIKEWIADS